MKADKIMTAEEIAEVRNAHKVLLEEKLAAVSSFEPSIPTPNDQWSPMVWPSGGKAESPNTGVPEQVLRDVGKASVTISPEGFVRFPSKSHCLVFSYVHNPGNPSSSQTPHKCSPREGQHWKRA
jgi:hypothetical protein